KNIENKLPEVILSKINLRIQLNWLTPKLLMTCLLLMYSLTGFTQQKKRIEIEQADYWEAAGDIAPNASRLVGNLRIRHESMLLWADSAYTYSDNNRVDAFGNVRINQGDTLNLYANK